MKQVRTFEQYTNNRKFNIGDYVKCIDVDETEFLNYNKIYIVSSTLGESDGYNKYITLEGNSHGTYNENRFVIPTPKEIEQYKLEQESNKYNL